MPREKEDFRAILADILEYTGGRRLLTIKDVSEYLGIKAATAKKRFGLTKEGIMAQTLARRLCQ